MKPPLLLRLLPSGYQRAHEKGLVAAAGTAGVDSPERPELQSVGCTLFGGAWFGARDKIAPLGYGQPLPAVACRKHGALAQF